MFSTRDPIPAAGRPAPVAATHSGRRLGRVVSVVALAALVPGVTGCKNLNYQRPTEPAMNPTGGDEAIARRQWGETNALYANSGVRVYATRFRYNYATASQQSPYSGIILGPLAFVAQSLAFPLSFLRAKPGATEVQRPLSVEPSFTLNPNRVEQGTVDADTAAVTGAGGGPTTPAGTPVQPSAPGVTPGGTPGGVPANPVPGTPRQGLSGDNATPGTPNGASPASPSPSSVVPELTPPGTPGGTPAPGQANPSNPAPGGASPGGGGGPVGPGGAGGAGGGGAGGR
jgi:hypothetical protein